MSNTPDETTLQRLCEAAGKGGALWPGDDLTRYTHENRDRVIGRTPLVLRPADTQSVSRILAIASETGTAIVPQGGHTGHAGGAVPDPQGNQVVVSLERMNRIREVDVMGNTMTVEAGVILERIREEAASHDRLFALSLASQGSCQIGGNIATNAGGTGVLAHGSTRNLVLGLEAVLPSGEIWNGLTKLKKDNTGYDLKQLFIGSEGTLGIVTAAVVRLLPRLGGRRVALAGVASPHHAHAFFRIASDLCGSSLTAFELMPRIGLDFLFAQPPARRDPLSARHEWYVLAEISSGRSEEDADGLMQQVLEAALAAEAVEDGVVAASGRQMNELWALREELPAAQKAQGASLKHDISVAVHLMAEFMERADRLVLRAMPEARICAFGHLGDGNIHYNITQPRGMDSAAFIARREEIGELVHGLLIEMGGSISAEHGIGLFKRDLLAATKSKVELDMMRAIKQALDPRGIMNPGKVL